ncbi:hypothetical protein MMC11_006223 [Xylographa trunciseda]|nr:hypothetical protein [Xylographa trunciseda]
MKSSTLSIMTTILAALTQAAPTPVQASPRQDFKVALTFFGAARASFDMEVPTDDTLHLITNPLSISSIYSNGGGDCSFFGVNGSGAFLPDSGTVFISPPQTQVSVVCDVA